MEIVGLIPAAGRATRLGNIDRSKELLEIDFQGKRQVISKFLIDNYKEAGIRNIHFIIRDGKWDIPAFYNNGSRFDIHVAYQLAKYPYGVPFTLYEATHFISDRYVALGFPDMYLTPTSAFDSLRQKMVATNSDLVLGLFPVKNTSKWDMVELNDKGQIIDIKIKPQHTQLTCGWSVALWSPLFTRYLQDKIHFFLKNEEKERLKLEKQLNREIYPGDIFKSFILEGHKTDYVLFEDGECIDLGTWDDFNNFNHDEKIKKQ